MTDNVVNFPGGTILDIPVKKIVKNMAKKETWETLTDIVAIARDENGEWLFWSSTSSVPKVLLMLKKCEKEMLDGI